MRFSKKIISIFMKCTIIAISLSISLIPGIVSMFALSIILSEINAHHVVSAVIFFIVIIVTMFFCIQVLRKVYRYLDKETKSYLDSLP